jgi:helix-turn-helix protein
MSYKFEVGELVTILLTGERVMILSKERGKESFDANVYSVRHQDYEIRVFKQFELEKIFDNPQYGPTASRI